MRFLSQDLRSGSLEITEAPEPTPAEHGVVVRTIASLISAGTERMLVDFGRANLLDKARQQPDRVREVLDRARAEGIVETVDAVRSKLGQRLPLGYAGCGRVVAIGTGVRGFAVGDLVATNGGHAEVVSVPATLVATVPDGVTPEAGAFATVGAIALEGVRLAGADLGGRSVVTGLGLIGLLAVQLLHATGCRVLGIDPDPGRRAIAESLGATTAPPDAALSAASTFSGGHGVDAVLVCAATKSSDPMRDAARMCRERGTVVLVGVTGLELERAPLYENEVAVRVSRSYGPGRYDADYERGHDYPFGLVRWTAGRNMQTILDLLGSGALTVDPLVSHRFAFDDAERAYDAISDDAGALGVVLEYGDAPPARPVSRAAQRPSTTTRATPGRLAVIGAGSFAARTLVPAITAAGGGITYVAAPNASAAALVAGAAGARATTDVDEVLGSPEIGAVFIATRHDSHADLAIRALRAGKAVYVEKPLGLTHEQLDAVAATLTDESPVLTVGFNRRFAPVTVAMIRLLAPQPGPKAVVITVNAGAIPSDHWVHDPAVGGGRVLGEGCHFVDLARHLVGASIVEVRSAFLGGTPSNDSATVSLQFADGSTAEIHYLANGSARFPKERVEVFAHGRVLVNENFRSMRAYGWPGARRTRVRKQDKGHEGSVRAFLDAARRGGSPPIDLAELFEVSEAAITAGSPT